jgi:16S rRNA (guanine527-N7)-methyltransferase
VVETPGLTALSLEEARHVLLDDSLRALELVRSADGPVVDVGSGGGAPGLPLAYALPDREFILLEAERRKCEFLERWAPPNARVVRGRAEEQPIDWAGVALAKALAAPPVAAEWCLPLVRPGGVALVWVGVTADRAAVERVAGVLAAEVEASESGLFVMRKTGPTPAGFPRRTGVAKKRPLAQ